MFQDKLFQVIGVWLVIIVAYILMAVTASIHSAIVTDVQATMATQNLSANGIVGVSEWLGTFPLHMWFIPGLVGVVFTVIRLRV